MHFYDYQLHEIDYYDFSIPQVMMDILQKLQEELDENDEIRIRRATPPVPPAPPTRTPYIVLPGGDIIPYNKTNADKFKAYGLTSEDGIKYMLSNPYLTPPTPPLQLLQLLLQLLI